MVGNDYHNTTVMAITVRKYAKDRISEKEGKAKQQGPVVTISRQLGCPAKPIAGKLVELINKESKQKWNCISKEILKESASKLGIPASELKYFFKYNEQGVLDGMLSTISKFYVSDIRAGKAVKNAISSIAGKGNVVIIGRGGAAICRDMGDSIHVRLTAPVEWRLAKVMDAYDMRHKEALKFLKDYDNKRINFLMQFSKENDPAILFDIYYNCARFDIDDIAHSIYSLMQIRGLIS